MICDVMVIGGSYAGLAVAMQLARARKLVFVVDAGQPRNRFACAAQGFGPDGKSPFTILEETRRQLRAYPDVRIIDGTATTARAVGNGFEVMVTKGDGQPIEALRLVLATGLRDELPSIPGLEERWGTTVLYYPYQAYEMRDQPLGVLGNHPMAIRQAMMVAGIGPPIYFTQGKFDPDEEQAARLRERRVRLERTPVVELLGYAPSLEEVRLEDGRTVRVKAMFTQPKTHMASPLAEQLGCAFEEGPTGRYVLVDEWKQTTVAGVYAVGDAASTMHNATVASASGIIAGIGVHQSLTAER